MRRARRMISSRSASVSCRNREPRSTWSRCVGDEPLQARLEKTDLGPPLDHEPPRHQPLPPPAGHRPRRDVVALAHLRHRQDRLADLLDRLPDRRREVLDEQPQVVLDVLPFEDQGRPPSGRIPRDPEAKVFVGILLRSARSRPAAARRARSARAGGPWARTASAGPSVVSSRDGGTLSHPDILRLDPPRTAARTRT